MEMRLCVEYLHHLTLQVMAFGVEGRVETRAPLPRKADDLAGIQHDFFLCQGLLPYLPAARKQ
jgi:hypothetical protein